MRNTQSILNEACFVKATYQNSLGTNKYPEIDNVLLEASVLVHPPTFDPDIKAEDNSLALLVA